MFKRLFSFVDFLWRKLDDPVFPPPSEKDKEAFERLQSDIQSQGGPGSGRRKNTDKKSLSSKEEFSSKEESFSKEKSFSEEESSSKKGSSSEAADIQQPPTQVKGSVGSPPQRKSPSLKNSLSSKDVNQGLADDLNPP
jgi:hypothetical protein